MNNRDARAKGRPRPFFLYRLGTYYDAGRLFMNNSARGRSWEEIQAEIFTPEEIRESRLRVAIIGELIKARQ